MGAKDAQIQEAQSNQSALEKESQRLHTTILELDTTSQVHCQGRTFHNILVHVLWTVSSAVGFGLLCLGITPPPPLPPKLPDTYFIFSFNNKT